MYTDYRMYKEANILYIYVYRMYKKAVATHILWPLREILCEMEIVWFGTLEWLKNKTFKMSQIWPRMV